MKKFAVYRMSLIGVIAAVLIAIGVEIKWPSVSNAQSHWTESPQVTRQDLATAPKIDVSQLNQAFVTLAERMSPAVVNIYTKTRIKPVNPSYGMPETELFQFFFGNPFGGEMILPPMEREAQSLGSGFIINSSGYIVTNSHVVHHAGKSADEIMVKFLNDKGKGFPATVVGVDERSDVALLKLKNPKASLTVAPLGDSSRSKVGEWVVAIGNPYGHSHTVTNGIVSALGRNLDGIAAEFIQTSASINPGNSGGPLFNLYGEVIGINTAIDARAQGIGFAIPINSAKPIIESLIEDGKVRRGYIGVFITSVSPEVADALGLEQETGVIIREVVADGPADKAGMKKGDIITKVADQPITDETKLIQVVSSKNPGEKVAFEVIRKGKKQALTVRIEEEKVQETQNLQSRWQFE